MFQNKKEDEKQVGPLTEVTKKDLQITAFHIKASDQKSELYGTVYDFTITIQQVREGTRVLFASHLSGKKFKN